MVKQTTDEASNSTVLMRPHVGRIAPQSKLFLRQVGGFVHAQRARHFTRVTTPSVVQSADEANNCTALVFLPLEHMAQQTRDFAKVGAVIRQVGDNVQAQRENQNPSVSRANETDASFMFYSLRKLPGESRYASFASYLAFSVCPAATTAP